MVKLLHSAIKRFHYHLHHHHHRSRPRPLLRPCQHPLTCRWNVVKFIIIIIHLSVLCAAELLRSRSSELTSLTRLRALGAPPHVE